MSQKVMTWGVVYKGHRDQNDSPVLMSVGPGHQPGFGLHQQEEDAKNRANDLNERCGRENFEARPMIISVCVQHNEV